MKENREGDDRERREGKRSRRELVREGRRGRDLFLILSSCGRVRGKVSWRK